MHGVLRAGPPRAADARRARAPFSSPRALFERLADMGRRGRRYSRSHLGLKSGRKSTYPSWRGRSADDVELERRIWCGVSFALLHGSGRRRAVAGAGGRVPPHAAAQVQASWRRAAFQGVPNQRRPLQAHVVVVQQDRRGDEECATRGLPGRAARSPTVPPRRRDAIAAVAIRGCAVRSGLEMERKFQQTRFRDMTITIASPSLPLPLGIVCKDRKEFRAWYSGLRYLAENGPPPGWAAWKERARRTRELHMRRGTVDGAPDGPPADGPPAGVRLTARLSQPAAADLDSADDADGGITKMVSSRQLRDRIKGASAAPSCAPALTRRPSVHRSQRRAMCTRGAAAAGASWATRPAPRAWRPRSSRACWARASRWWPAAATTPLPSSVRARIACSLLHFVMLSPARRLRRGPRLGLRA